VPRPRSTTRQRMVSSAAGLIRRHGASATSIDRVLEVSGAPRGSVYHHFPGGRAQLVEEAVGYADRYVCSLLDAAAASGDPVAVVDQFLTMWREQLVASDFQAGCPVVAVAVEANEEAPRLTEAAGAALGHWQAKIRSLLADAGLAPARADRLATLVVAAVEGALVLSRAQRRTDPLDAVALELRDLLTAALN
jgi:AcrR family transcriptional regulator